MQTTTLLLLALVARGPGAIVNIASTAGYAPAPFDAAYAASKAFMLSFARSVSFETRGTAVRVVAVNPGAIEAAMNPNAPDGKRKPEQVAETVVKALCGRAIAVVGDHVFAVRAFVFGRLLPIWTTDRITGIFFRPAAAWKCAPQRGEQTRGARASDRA